MNKIKKYIIIILTCILGSIIFYFIGGKQLKQIEQNDSLTEGRGAISELTSGQILEQLFVANMDVIETIEPMVATYARQNDGIVLLQILDNNTKEILRSSEVDISDLVDNAYYTWSLDEPLDNMKGKILILRITSFSKVGESIGFYYGDKNKNQESMILNGTTFSGVLTIKINGFNYSIFGNYYWLWVFAAIVVLMGNIVWSDYEETKGKLTKGKVIVAVWHKYRFLIEQLVARDFKTKYKRSVLGYLWSFLNPLLTMLVQYIVFSTIFKSGIDNYPVYLLSGIILFNFFSEAVGQGLMSIVYNAALITKVYVPKYIYPVTKVASTSINLFISVIPLLLVTLMTGVKITPAILLLPFVLACLLMFCVGMVLMLSAATVFFRDTQYLWGIFSMVWMYATPLFYPENIIPAKFRIIQTVNPMYHLIKFTRIILIEGVSPAPMQYGTCILSAVVTCLLGAIVFKRTQNKFILYI